MAVNQFIPAIWSARILQKLNDTLVYGQPQIVNQDFQGEISAFGNTVYAHGFSDVTVAAYTRNLTTLAYQQLTDERRQITIDQSDYFGVKLDDLDAAQIKPKILDQVSQNAAYQLAAVQDRFLSGQYVNAGQTLDDAGTARSISSSNVYSTFVTAGEMLDDNNVPEEGRYAVIPPWMASILLLDDRYFLQARGDAVLNGQIGQIAGISILKSNRVPTTGAGTSTDPTVWNVMIGHNLAITFASQINQTEGLRDKDTFSDLLRGLTLYGARTLYPEALVNLRAKK